MATQYFCSNENRRALVRDALKAGKPFLNGIDYLEVGNSAETELDVHFLQPLPGQTGGVPASPHLKPENIAIDGGARIVNVQVVSIHALHSVLRVTVDKPGDFSPYTLRLVQTGKTTPPKNFDPQLSEIVFSFKANCKSDIDCETQIDCPPDVLVAPDIDYLAKDYNSFRRLMLDRLSVLMPEWTERNPADPQVTLVETLAYAADHLSYYQDAVATEAYLHTARQRTSIRRHARLLDYFMHEGCNARVWLQLHATSNVTVAKGAAFLAGVVNVPDGDVPPPTLVFETMHDVDINTAHNAIAFYTWSDTECCLPKGATSASLVNKPALALKIGDVLLLEETEGPQVESHSEPDVTHRHVVRLTSVEAVVDPLDGTKVLNIAWGFDDALPFPLCLTVLKKIGTDPVALVAVSVARGNIVLADNGRTIDAPAFWTVAPQTPAPPALEPPPLTHVGLARDAFGDLVLDNDDQPLAFDPSAPAAAAMRWSVRDTLPAVRIVDDRNLPWYAQRDLLESGRFDRDFVAEIDNNGAAQLRFGDGTYGQAPVGTFNVTYRTGNGTQGNVAQELISSLDVLIVGVDAVRNPMPSSGGVDPESTEDVRQFAPQAFRVQERAVTEADWAEVAQRHPEVQKAAATMRWTGSWQTVFVTIDRLHGLPVDGEFIAEMEAFLERFRIAGYDLTVNAPTMAPLDIAITVCIAPGYFQVNVREALRAVFRAFFDPDNFTFGQPLFLSRIYAAAMGIAGVASVDVTKFQRYGKLANGELDKGVLQPAHLEIIRCDNDPNFPQHGILTMTMEGGL